MQRGFKVKALGEIAIRCRDLEVMTAFYRDIIGLDVLEGAYSDNIVFLRIAEGYGGHTAVLALFRDDAGAEEPLGGGQSSLHHLALTVGREEQDRAVEWYMHNGINYTIQEFAWIGWRGVFTSDPEGNTVELVAYDRAVARAAP
jgi:catechol-2,3-dioxygenase